MATEGIAPGAASQQDMDQQLHVEASIWWVRLEAAPADAKLAGEFEIWLGQSDQHRLAYAELASLGYALEQLEPPLPRPLGLVSSRASARPWIWLARGAPLLLVAGWLWLLLPGWWQDFQADQISAVGEIRTETLDDGSVLTLDSDTAVRVRLRSTRREIELLRGNLHVQVRPDPLRPFEVRAAEISATALGTAYSVDHDSGRVVVDHGRVAVEDDHGRVVVNAGQAALPGTAGWQLSAAAVSPPDWTRRQRVFEQVPLREVLMELDRYLPGRLWLRETVPLEASVTAVLDLHDPGLALSQLCAAHGLSLQYWPGVIVIGAQ